MIDNNDILKKARKDKVELVYLNFSDINGTLKSVTIPVEKLERALGKGVWFDGSSIEGFTRIDESDLYLKPDVKTYALVPWEKETKTARLICDVFTPDDKPFEGDPRFVLKREIEKARKLGFEYFTGPELEFFLFEPNGQKKTVFHDKAGYFDATPSDKAGEIRKEIMFSLKNFGISAETSHHEVAEGQHEIGFTYDTALRTSDNALTLKMVVKSIASAHGLNASFMPKPVFGINGSGMHVHQSLFREGKNVFYDEKKDYNLSETALHFIAGQLNHARAMSAIVSPTINSFKRLIPGYEAPVYICWGQRNRSALIRIPRTFRGDASAARAELRCPDPSANPYLALTVMLEAGLDGIKNKMMPVKPLEESAYGMNRQKRQELEIRELPFSLAEAVEELKNDEVIFNCLGEHLKKVYVQSKENEIREYRMQVTNWELEKYF